VTAAEVLMELLWSLPKCHTDIYIECGGEGASSTLGRGSRWTPGKFTLEK